MKKQLILAGAIAFASLAGAAPAMALTPASNGNIVCQFAVQPSLYWLGQFAPDGSQITTTSGGVDTNFNAPGSIMAVDNAKSIAYIFNADSIFSTDLVTEGNATEIADASAVGGAGSPVGLAVDDLTGKLYASAWDSGAGHYIVLVLNTTTNSFDDYLTLTSGDIADGGNLAFYDGHIYVIDRNSHDIVVFDAITGVQTGLITGSPDFYTGYNSALHVTADGRIFVYSETSIGSDYGVNFYDLATSAWTGNVDAVDLGNYMSNFESCTWWGAPEVAKTPELPNTGADVLGMSLAATTLLAAGGVLTMIRRRATH